MPLDNQITETLDFLQEIIDDSHLGLEVSRLNGDDFEFIALQKETQLNWFGYHPHFEHHNSVPLGFRLSGIDDDVDGAVLGIYDPEFRRFNLFLLESFVQDNWQHPLKGRLTTLVIIAITYFLSLIDDSDGALIVEPDPRLVSFYEDYNFTLIQGEKMMMYASVEALQEIQENLVSGLTIE